MATTSTLPSISLLTSTPGLDSAAVPTTTASFTLTISESTTLRSIASRNDSSTLGASSTSPSSSTSLPTTDSATASVVTVEVSPSSNGNNNNEQSYPIGLILGIVTGFSILILVMGIMFLILWKNRQQGGARRGGGGDEANEMLSIRQRRKGFKALAGLTAAESRPLRKGSVDSTRSEDAEDPPLPPLPPPPPSRRRVSKPQPLREDNVGRGGYGAHARGWHMSVGTSMVPVQSPRDRPGGDGSGGDRHTSGEEERSYLPFHSQDTTLVRKSPSTVPILSPYRPPLSHLNYSLQRAPFSAPHPLSHRRRLSHPEMRAGGRTINPLGMNPPASRIITPGSAVPNSLHHHHARSRSSNDIANAAAAQAQAQTATARSRPLPPPPPPPKYYQRPLSRLRRYDPDHHQRSHNSHHPHHSNSHTEYNHTGTVGSFAPAPITTTITTTNSNSPPSEPSSSSNTGTNSSGGRHHYHRHHPQSSEPDSMSSPHSRSCSGDDVPPQQLEFFELSPPPRRREGSSSWPTPPLEGGQQDSSNISPRDQVEGGGDRDRTLLRPGLTVVGEGGGDQAGGGGGGGRIDRGSGVRISGVDQLAGGPAPLDRRHGEEEEIGEEEAHHGGVVVVGGNDVGSGEDRDDETFLHA